MRSYIKAITTLFVISLIGLVITTSACNSSNSAQFSDETIQKFKAAVQEQMAAHNIPGVVLGVWQPGKGNYLEAFGVKNIETGEPMETHLQYRVGSITKTFISTVILQLVDEGLISLDDTVDAYVPQIPNADQITIRMVNNHTSGIANYLFVGDFYNEVQQQPFNVYAPMDLINVAASGTPVFSPPGSSWSYSNTNFIISGIIIEAVTGNDVEDEVRRRIIEPLGLTSTNFPEVADIITDDFIRGYADPVELADGAFEDVFSTVDDPGESGELQDISVYDPSSAWTAGAMTSSVPDLRIWVEALNDGILLSPESQQERFDFIDIPGFLGISSFKYGLGLMSIDGYIGHGGEIFGYEGYMGKNPDTNTTIIVALNNFPTDDIPALNILSAVATAIADEPQKVDLKFDKTKYPHLWRP